MNNGTGWYYETLICSVLLPIPIVFAFIILMYYSLTTSSPALITSQNVICYSCSVYGSDRYFITQHPIVVVYRALIAPYLPNFNRDAIFSLIITGNNLCTASESSLDVVLLVNRMISHSPKENNTGHYLQ